MKIRLTLDSKTTLDTWAEEFQSGEFTLKRKHSLNAIVHAFSSGGTLLKDVDFSKTVYPTSKEYKLRKDTNEQFLQLLSEIKRDSSKKTPQNLNEQDLANHVINTLIFLSKSPEVRSKIHKPVKDFIVEDIEENSRQIWLDLPVAIVEKAKKLLEKKNKGIYVNDYMAKQLALFLEDKDLDQLKAEVANFKSSEDGNKPKDQKDGALVVFIVLSVEKEVKKKISKISRSRFDFDESAQVLLSRSLSTAFDKK